MAETTKPKRKPLSKKIRFEVFKRDSFTCQYCGAKAPQVTLNVDHIKPVASGGNNDILNLVTSCSGCNAGKSDRHLSDDAVVKTQLKELHDQQARLEQLQMLMRWRDSLKKEHEIAGRYLIDLVNEYMHTAKLNANGELTVKALLSKYDMGLIIDAIGDAAVQYMVFDGDGRLTKTSSEHFISMIPRVCYYKANPDKAERQRQISYICGIMRNRFHFFDAARARPLLADAFEKGATYEQIEFIAKNARSWADFFKQVQQ